jgi:hypothetical protein
MLGREVNLPADLVVRPPDAVNGEDHEDYVNRLQGAIRVSHEIARNVLTTHQAQMKRDYDMRIREHKPGDLVYVLDTAKIKDRAKKLDPSWKGPGIVVEKLSSYVYTVKLKTMTFTTNHDRLKHCQDREIPACLRKCKHRLRDGENILEKEDGDILCIYKKPNDGGLMIQCDTCDDWFHGRCIGIAKEKADTLVTYYCPRCQLEAKK